METRHYSELNDAVSIEELLSIIEGKTEHTRTLRDCPDLYEVYCRKQNAMLILNKYLLRWKQCPFFERWFTKRGHRCKAKMMAMIKIFDTRKEEYEFLYKMYV